MPKIQASAPTFAGFRQLPGGGFPFTMVPNQFLDEIVPFEKPCVVKVVCLILRRTLGWIDQTGQRRQQDQVAYSEFAREMNMSTQAVADGLKIALDKGYIVRVKAGTMRDSASGNPEAACYSLRWHSPLKAIQPDSESAPVEESKAADSEKQTELSSLRIRDMINKADSEKTKQVELKPSSKICKPRGKFSSYLGNLVTEIGEQFGDSDHRLSNIKQALNCWEKSGLNEKEFAQLLYQARTLTRQHTSAVSNPAQPTRTQPDRSFSSWVTLVGVPAKNELPRPAKTSSAAPRNRMPYFFKVLQDLVDQPDSKAAPEKPVVQNESPKKQNLTLHKPKRVRALPVEKVVIQPDKDITTPETPPVGSLPAKGELPPELARMAERFASNSNLALSGWQRWEASLNDAKLKALANRALLLERSQVRPELQALLFPPETAASPHPIIRNDFLLVFRNAFDARYAASYIQELTRSLQIAGKEDIQVYITSI